VLALAVERFLILSCEGEGTSEAGGEIGSPSYRVARGDYLSTMLRMVPLSLRERILSREQLQSIVVKVFTFR